MSKNETFLNCIFIFVTLDLYSWWRVLHGWAEGELFATHKTSKRNIFLKPKFTNIYIIVFANNCLYIVFVRFEFCSIRRMTKFNSQKTISRWWKKVSRFLARRKKFTRKSKVDSFLISIQNIYRVICMFFQVFVLNLSSEPKGREPRLAVFT